MGNSKGQNGGPLVELKYAVMDFWPIFQAQNCHKKALMEHNVCCVAAPHFTVRQLDFCLWALYIE
jgi:hypothetical protein